MFLRERNCRNSKNNKIKKLRNHSRISTKDESHGKEIKEYTYVALNATLTLVIAHKWKKGGISLDLGGGGELSKGNY